MAAWAWGAWLATLVTVASLGLGGLPEFPGYRLSQTVPRGQSGSQAAKSGIALLVCSQCAGSGVTVCMCEHMCVDSCAHMCPMWAEPLRVKQTA